MSLGELVRELRLLPPEAMQRAIRVHEETGERIEAVITRLGLVPERVLADAVSRALSLPLLSATDFPAEPVSGRSLSSAFLHDMHVVPVALDGAGVKIALADPFNRFAIEAMEFVFGVPAQRAIALPSDIDAAIERLYRTDRATETEVEALIDDEDLERLKDLVSDAPVIRAVNRLIAQAVDAHASDIHVEPAEDRLAIRMRVDGVLVDAPSLPAAMRAPLVSRVKVMSGLNIAERRLPQDGRLRIAVRGNEIDLRVATAPSIHGESVVMRILDKSNLALEFGKLGFDEVVARQLRTALHKPHGIVLVTGPTGSGKTTTLYAALAELNSGRSKLLTIEDPIEYRLAGVIQSQVNPAIGFTFASALRSFLRQDPDVMMVGEIRDLETAQIAVQAALTGHMILSTLHTNTAAGAVTRLLDMDVEPFLLSSVLAAVLAQRLVRQLCPHCREPYQPDGELVEQLGATLPAGVQFFRATGCHECGGAGYRGRIALLELLVVDEAVAKLILRRADAREVAQAAAAGGMRSMLDDGLLKAAAGLTTIEEVVRVATGD